jgi:hypothetical protein
MKNLLFVFVLLFGASAFPQELKPSDFVIDPSKPFAYLKFDHIEPIKPNPDSKAEPYIWLRAVNNSRIPIVFRASGPPPGYPGVSLEAEVIEEEQGIQIVSDRDQADFDKEQKRRKERLKHKPEGFWFEVSGVARVQPGEELLFSVPRNYIDEFWYLRVRFTMELARSSLVVGPFTYLPFYDSDLPKDETPTKPATSQQSKK